jgi:hypothetical protein
LVENPAFVVKMLLIVLAGVNILVFHLGIYRGVARWDVNAPVPLPGKVAALVSLLVWFVVIACGRLIAYV